MAIPGPLPHEWARAARGHLSGDYNLRTPRLRLALTARGRAMPPISFFCGISGHVAPGGEKVSKQTVVRVRFDPQSEQMCLRRVGLTPVRKVSVRVDRYRVRKVSGTFWVSSGV
jgi:hypothetical protein